MSESPCTNPLHGNPLPKPYLAAHDEAEKRLEAGWDNRECPECRLFGWDPPACKHCGDPIKPNQTGGYYHSQTGEHRSDQRCFLYATPRLQSGTGA